MRVIHRIGLGLAVAALTLAQPAHAQQHVDFNSDGTPDTVRREVRLHITDPVVSRIVLVSGVDGAGLLSIAPKFTNDLFGWWASPAGDFDLDGVQDVLVTAPTCLIAEGLPATEPGGPIPDWRGRVDIYSGATGGELLSLFNPEATADCIFGLGAAIVPDQDADNIPDILVGGMKFVPAPTAEHPDAVTLDLRWWVMSTATLEAIRFGTGPVGETGCEFLASEETAGEFWTDAELAGPREFLPGIAGDLDGDGDVDSGDAASLIGEWTAGESGSTRVGDLNGDGEVGPSDLSILLASFGFPPDVVDAFGTTGEATIEALRGCRWEYHLCGGGFWGGGGLGGGGPGGGLGGSDGAGNGQQGDTGTDGPDFGGTNDNGCPGCPNTNTPNCPSCSPCTWCPPVINDDCQTQCECYPCSPSCDEDQDGIPNYCDGFGCNVPDPYAAFSQPYPIDLVLFPGEIGQVTCGIFPACVTDFYATIEDPAVAAVAIGNGQYIESANWSAVRTLIENRVGVSGFNPLYIMGLEPGTTMLQIRRDSPSGQVIAETPILVGGSMRVEVGGPLLFDGFPAPAPRPDDEQQRDGSVVLGGERGPIPEYKLQAIEDFPVVEYLSWVAPITVSLRDALGRPKLNYPVRVVFRNSGVVSREGEEVLILEPRRFHLRLPPDRGGFLEPVVLDDVAVLIGPAAIDFSDNLGARITRTDINAFRDSQRYTENTFVGDRIVYDSDLTVAPNQDPGRFVSMMSLPFALVSRQHYVILAEAIGGTVSFPLLFSPHAFNLVPEGGGDPILIVDSEFERPPLSWAVRNLDLERIIRQSIIDNRATLFQSDDLMIHVDIPQQGDGNIPIIHTAALVAELSLCMVPGVDIIDVARESVWKPLFNNEETDWIVASVAFAGLCADAGYLAAPVGVPLNFAAAALKVTFKRIPVSARRALIRNWDTATEGIQALIRLAERVPRPPGAGHLEHAAHIAETLINRINRLMNSPLGLSGDNVASALRTLERHAAREYTDEATEGIAWTIKHFCPLRTPCERVTQEIIQQFGDDVAEGAFDLARKLDLPSGQISEEAVRGVAAAVKTVGPPNIAVVRGIVEGSQYVGRPDRANKAFTAMNEIHEVLGADQMVRFLKRNASNVDGVDGSIYEATAVMRVKRGEVSGIGTLQEIAADGEEATRKIDAFTDQYALQMKFKGAMAPYYPSDLAGSAAGADVYLGTFKLQAEARDVTPCLVTNRVPSEDLLQMLSSKNIEHRLVAD